METDDDGYMWRLWMTRRAHTKQPGIKKHTGTLLFARCCGQVSPVKCCGIYVDGKHDTIQYPRSRGKKAYA